MVHRTSIALAVGWVLLFGGLALTGCSFENVIPGNNFGSTDDTTGGDSGAPVDPSDSSDERGAGRDGAGVDSTDEHDTALPDTETDCTNGRDDDGDGTRDCADPDCDGETCAPVGGAVCKMRVCAETACSDDQDNDLDASTDCEDTDCSDCSAAGEPECYDGKDEDGDGKADCADREDCDGQQCAAKGGAVCRDGDCHETICDNRIDDDGDDDIDSQDDDC